MDAFDCLIAVFWTVGRVDVVSDIAGNYEAVETICWNWSELFEWSDCGPRESVFNRCEYCL